MTDEQDKQHREWFSAEYPNTYADAIKGMTDADVIFAYSWCAWQEAVRRTENILDEPDQL